jgi:LAS superfamily LD-carboxypeptidase LdcB
MRGVALLSALIAVAGVPATADASIAHVVQPGETLWSIAAANNLTTRTVAAFNGISEDTPIVTGSTIDVPTVDEGAAALASAGTVPTAAPTDTSTTAAPAPSAPAPAPATPGLGYVYSPEGSVPLNAAAADSFNAMRQASLEQLGIDLYPDGTLSGYRTYDQQAYLYDLFLNGQGSPANPPGMSSHELGVSVDLADPIMRTAIDQLGPIYGWAKTEAPDEWWHVTYTG